jgi:hypothetical protein
MIQSTPGSVSVTLTSGTAAKPTSLSWTGFSLGGVTLGTPVVTDIGVVSSPVTSGNRLSFALPFTADNGYVFKNYSAAEKSSIINTFKTAFTLVDADFVGPTVANAVVVSGDRKSLTIVFEVEVD